MTITLHAIAEALVDLSSTLAPKDLPMACDEAITLVKRFHPGSPLQSFVREVEQLLRKKRNFVAVLSTTSGNVGEVANVLETAVAKSMNAKINLEERADTSLLGGALLLVGDERIDASLSGMLSRLSSTLPATL